jgi:hypothetical protein
MSYMVRDRALKKSDYKGHEVPGVDKNCPCRPCYNPHDCGYLDSQAHWISRFHCATNWDRGCPPALPEPKHEVPDGHRVCIHCGWHKPTKKRELKHVTE